MIFQLFKPFQTSQRASLLFNASLIALMMGCVGISYMQLVERAFPGWPGGYVPWLCALISLEASYTHLSNRDRPFEEQARNHIAEWVVLFFVIKLLTLIFGGPGSLLREVSLWEKDPIYFLSPGFVAGLAPAVIVWVISFAFSLDLASIQVDEDELYMDNPAILDKNKVDYRQRLGEWVMLVGIFLVLIAFLTRADLVQVFGEIPAARAPIYNVVAYFLFGFILLSQAQLSSLRRHWLWDKIPTGARLSGRWLQYTLVFLFLLALLAVLLPTRYTVGLLDTLYIIFNFIYQLVMFLLILITYPFIALFNLLTRLIGKQGPAIQPQVQMPRFEEAPAPRGEPLPWIDFLRSLLFWLLLAGMIFYFFRYYLREKRGLWATLRKIGLVKWLLKGWHGLAGWLRGAGRQVRAALKAGQARLFPHLRAGPASAVRRFIHLRDASPRQRVILFYLRLVERGGEQGIPRGPAQTPYQYSQQLHRTLPEVESELDGMTEAFLEARYSAHEVDDKDASAVQSLCKRILQALRGVKGSRGA